MRVTRRMNEPRLKIRGLKVAYSHVDLDSNPILSRFIYRSQKTHLILKNVDLTVHLNEILGLVGESGCGKSVAVKSIFGMINFSPGIIDGSIEYISSNGDKNQILSPEKNVNGFKKNLGAPVIDLLERQHTNDQQSLFSPGLVELWQYDDDMNYSEIEDPTAVNGGGPFYLVRSSPKRLSMDMSHEIEKSYSVLKAAGKILSG